MLVRLPPGFEVFHTTLARAGTPGRPMSSAAQLITPAIRILRLPDVCKATGLGRAMIYRLQAEKRFPRSVKITEHAVGWIEGEVQAWLANRVAAR
jgi:prophage regulatory protein